MGSFETDVARSSVFTFDSSGRKMCLSGVSKVIYHTFKHNLPIEEIEKCSEPADAAMHDPHSLIQIGQAVRTVHSCKLD